MTSSLQAYRNSAAHGATHLDILLLCYDALAQDIRQAGVSAERNDIPGRCRDSEHALLLLGHLESWIDALDDANLRDSLSAFYEYIRLELLRCQAANQSDPFFKLAMLICETRAVWQRKQSPAQLSVAAQKPPDMGLGDAQTGSRFTLSA